MAETTIFLNDVCFQHRYIRSKDKSNIVERPERLRAVNVGISCAIARLESIQPDSSPNKEQLNDGDVRHLVESMDKMQISPINVCTDVPRIIKSQATVDILNNASVNFVHGEINGDSYLHKLRDWAANSWDAIFLNSSEIPEGLPQGDLYLCPESVDAIQGTLGTVCEAVDKAMNPEDPLKRAFVVVRPPGHHCGEDTPSGFCFVNNVAVAAAHAHLNYNVNRIVIFDIDLHHGNGTQSIAWSINEQTYRQTLEVAEGLPPPRKLGPKVYYGSIHDILSFPCEDGTPALVQAASVSIHQSHGQYIENIHLQTYESEDHFWNVLYEEKYSRLIRRAEDFLGGTGGPGEDVLAFISCGMDACEHEYSSMSRHNRKVPASFYYRFTRDACAFANKYASGKLISVLEGGYSDLALISGSMAHICGLVASDKVDEEWWNIQNLTQLEKATKKRRGGHATLGNSDNVPTWLERTVAIFDSIDQSTTRMSSYPVPVSNSGRKLRDRAKLNNAQNEKKLSEPEKRKTTKSTDSGSSRKPNFPIDSAPCKTELISQPSLATSQSDISLDSSPTNTSNTEPNELETSTPYQKQVPKVILKLGKKPEEVGSKYTETH